MSGTATAPQRPGASTPTTHRGGGMTARVDAGPTSEDVGSVYSTFVRAGTMLIPKNAIGPVNILRCVRDATGGLDLAVEIWPLSHPRQEPAWTLTGENAALFLMDTRHPVYDAQHNRILPVIMEAAMAQGRALIEGPQS